MDCKKSNWQSCFPCKLFRFFVIVSPAFENRRSLGTELATIDNHFLAIGAKSLYQVIQIGIRAPRYIFFIKKKSMANHISSFSTTSVLSVSFLICWCRLYIQIHNQDSEYKQILVKKMSNKKLRLW
jgi:hypothetical protein